MLTLEAIQAILDRITYKDWQIIASHAPGSGTIYLTVGFRVGPVTHLGRRWLLSPHMTPSEVVQTALKAVLTAEEHEAREQFRYRGKAIFGPHFDVEELVDLCVSPDAYDVRK